MKKKVDNKKKVDASAEPKKTQPNKTSSEKLREPYQGKAKGAKDDSKELELDDIFNWD